MSDTFYDLVDPDVKKIKAIFRWGYRHALRTDIDKLDCSVSIRREPTDKPFSEIVKLITPKAVGYFRIVVLREYAHSRGVMQDGQVVSDLMELFIRSLDVGEVEYFIFMYLRAERLEELMKKYSLKRL
jgi:hypothetical protein